MLPQISAICEVTMPYFPNAVCADVDPEIFFPYEKGKDSSLAIWVAKEFCFTCVHRVDCLAWALKEEITDGVWGGVSATEREAMAKPKVFKTRTDLGEKSYELRNKGVAVVAIAKMFDSTPTAVSKAIARHIQTIEVAS